MAKGRITSSEVAKRAGVSQSAVSRVFSGASASKDTAQRVREAARDLGYRPNVLARSLITGQSRIIGVVVAYLENQFYPDALERLSIALQEQGYHILIFTVSNQGVDAEQVIQELMDYQVDGIIAASVSLSNELAAQCQNAGIPVVLFNRGQEDERLAEVTSDNFAGGAEIARYLVETGHQRIAHISGWQGSSTGQDRSAGFRAGLDQAGIPLLAELDGRYDRDIASEAAKTLMRDHQPDAIFVGNDHMAFGVMDALRFDLGLDVPRDVSVIGYDDVPMAAWAAYKLTTLRQPSGQMVAATVDALMAQINDPSAKPQKTRITGALKIRASARTTDG